MVYSECLGLNWRTALKTKCFYVLMWCLEECDGEHQDINIRTLDQQGLAELVSEALAAWDGGAR
jgi:hypothetical protein